MMTDRLDTGGDVTASLSLTCLPAGIAAQLVNLGDGIAYSAVLSIYTVYSRYRPTGYDTAPK